MEAQDIFETINKVRENPNLVVNQIKDQLKRFESSNVYRSKSNTKIRTFSGKAGWQQTILAIQRQKPKPNLRWNQLLAIAAEEYKQVAQQDDSINPFQVIKSICSYEGNISFNINESDTDQDLVQLLAAMVVGDGDEKKGVRTAIFHPLYKEFACSVRKSGNKNIVYTIFAQSVSQPTQGKQKQKSKPQSQSKQDKGSSSRSNWEDMPIKKQESEQVKNASISNKYKPTTEAINTKEQYIKRGKQLVAELNKIRKQPKQYVHALKAELQKFKDEKTINADFGIITTKQGQAPYYDLISELQTQYPLPTIRQIGGLTIVAIQQIIECEALMENKVPVEQLLDKFCAASEGVRSIKLKQIQGMPIASMLMRLLVGDGDRKRTARRKMLSPICKAIGCAISKDTLVVNVGETAKDNQPVVEQYMENLNDTNTKSKKQQVSFKLPSKTSETESPYFGVKTQSKGSSQNEKVVIKKTSKSHTQKKAGRMYKITQIQITYDDGQMENIVQEELLN